MPYAGRDVVLYWMPTQRMMDDFTQARIDPGMGISLLAQPDPVEHVESGRDPREAERIERKDGRAPAPAARPATVCTTPMGHQAATATRGIARGQTHDLGDLKDMARRTRYVARRSGVRKARPARNPG